MRLRRATAVVALLACLGLTACERADERVADTGATTLSVYASLELQGPRAAEAQAVANGARLALREAEGRAGELIVKLVVIDDSTPPLERWDREQTADNARTVVRDRAAIAYLGDGPSGATAISLPVLNAAGVLQVSPTSAYQGLTGAQDALKGEPEKYYPSGVRSFARPVPGDDVQARALVAGLRAERCRRLQLLEDRDVAGGGLATAVAGEAERAGIKVVGRTRVAANQDVTREAAAVAEGLAGCVVFAGALAPWVPRLFDALHAADRRLELFAGDGVAVEEFAAALTSGTQTRVHLTAPVGVLVPRPAIRAFARRYEQALGIEARSGALYGYEAMRLVLAAVERAGRRGNNRRAVIDALYGLGTRSSPIGSYAIDPDGNTTSTEYSRLGVRGGRLVHRRTGSFPSA